MRLNKVIKVKLNKALKNQEAVDCIRDILGKHFGEEYTFIVCEDGMDIEPLFLLTA